MLLNCIREVKYTNTRWLLNKDLKMTCIVERISWLSVFLLFSCFQIVSSQNADNLYRSSREHLNLGNYDQALVYINHALIIDSSKADYYLQRATIYYHQKVYDKTIRDCYTTLKLKSDIPEVYMLRGKVCQVTESYGGAILFFGKAIKYTSENEILYDAFLNRGKAYFNLKKYYDARSDFLSAYDIKPNSLDLLLAMSENYLKTNEKDKALATLRRAIEIDASYSPSYKLSGCIAMEDRDYPGAIHAYSKYCELEPKTGSAYNMLGEAYLMNKDYENSMNALKIAQSLTPNDPMIYKLKGLVYIEQDDHENGCNTLFRAFQLGYLEQYGYDLLDIYLEKCESQ